MGTGKSGRYLHTKGSASVVSQFALVHANEGSFVKDPRTHKVTRLANGGHGQDGMNLLNRYGLRYEVNHTYENGVRYGNVLDHRDRNKRERNGQTWFPSTWSSSDIKRAGKYVASLRRNQHVPDGVPVFGTYNRVRVGIIMTHGQIATIFPDKNQPE